MFFSLRSLQVIVRQLVAGPADGRHAPAEAAALVPKGVACLMSALQFDELTLQMPSSV